MLKRIIATLLTIAMVIQGSALAFSEEMPVAAALPDAAEAAQTVVIISADAENQTSTLEASEKSTDENIVTAQQQIKGESTVKTTVKKNVSQLTKKRLQEQKELKYKKGLAAYIRKVNKRVSKKQALSLAGTFIKVGKKHNLDPKVLMALAVRESRFNTKCYHSGYKGLMQTSDALATHYGYKPNDLYKASVSIDVAARYLKYLKKRFGTYTKALCGYAYGSGAVATGRYNIEVGRKVMRRRDEITQFLKKNKYI